MHRQGIARAAVVCIVTECRLLGDALTYMLRLRAGLRRVVVLRDVPAPGEPRLAVQPTVVLVDLQADATPRLRERIETAWPGAGVVILGARRGERSDGRCRMPRERCIPRDASWEELLDALNHPALLRGAGGRSSRGCPDGEAARDTELSPRERETASLMSDGLSNREIAARLGVSVATVKNHVHHILMKLHAHSRGQAVAQLRAPEQPSR